MAIVYQHVRKDNNEIFYVGIGTNLSRAYSKSGRSKFWTRYTTKYEYIVEILYENLSWIDACKIEIELIKKHGRVDTKTGTLLNFTDGGQGTLNHKHSEEAKTKIRDSRLGKKASLETLKKISLVRKGSTHTEETKNALRDRFLGVLPVNCKKVLQLDLKTGDIIEEHLSIAKAAKKINISPAAIIACCKGKVKKSGGYKWIYK